MKQARRTTTKMRPLIRTVEVIMERIPLHSRWASERWQPAAVEIAAAEAASIPSADRIPGTHVCAAEGENRWRCRGFEIELHPTEAEGYFLNITAPDPRIFVMWRMFDDGVQPPARPVLLTVSYNQAGRYMDGGEQVDGVAMIPAIADWMRPFIAEHYKPEPRRKVKRNDPLGDAASALRRRHS
jgi:hypothetical protein